MKRFLILTLALLLATTSFVLTDADAFDYDWRTATRFGAVWGETYVHTWYDPASETAGTYHWYYVENDLENAVKAYFISTAGVTWNGGSESPPPREEAAWVEAHGTATTSENFSFSMGGKDEGMASVWGTSQLKVRNLATSQKRDYPTASCSTSFWLP